MTQLIFVQQQFPSLPAVPFDVKIKPSKQKPRLKCPKEESPAAQ
jgi:hypothetical protein